MTAPDSLDREVTETLQGAWISLMDDASAPMVEFVKGAIFMAWRLGLLTDDARELWERRIKGCPGHSTPRSWCAFCGDVEEEWEEFPR